MTRAVILVPRREGVAERDALWLWCRAWWERHVSHLPIIEGHHTTGLFNRSAAINRASDIADATFGRWDIAVIIDADVVVDPERVRQAVAMAQDTGAMVLPYTHRQQLNRKGSAALMAGEDPETLWRYVARTYDDGCSSVVVVRRSLWDRIGGFDPEFRGWGFEDNAFAAAAVTFSGQDIAKIPGDLWHLWHPTARGEGPGSASYQANRARAERYRIGIGDPFAIDLARAAAGVAPLDEDRIPRILHRTVPEVVDPVVEAYWERWRDLHPGWRLLTWRDVAGTGRPDPDEFPESARVWQHAAVGAQVADLVRLEALWRYGGVYVDADVEPYRSLEPLLPLHAFAAWEDRNVIPNAVLGARREHPAIRACLDEVLALVKRQGRKGRTADVWKAGPGVTTRILRRREDVLDLPPGTFYPYHYRDKAGMSRAAFEALPDEQPWAFGAHHWAGSWLPEDKRW